MNGVAASPTPEQIRTLFNRIAPVYDQFNDWLSLGQHRVWKKMAVKWSNPHPSATCLDLCCGSGDLTQMLAQQVGVTGQVFGVDFSSEQLAIAKSRSKPLICKSVHHHGQSGCITWLEADVLDLPFDDAAFDAITMGYGLRNVASIPRCLQEIHRVLKPDCKAAILDLNQPENHWVQAFQQWYLQTIVVPLATQFGLTEEYAYLGPSLSKFPAGPEQVNLALQAGFSQAVHYPIAGGTMGVLVLTKS
jgi:demethylmenaquinone methyltransferase/2-methoxy-6-polyprenyl-1,4-benzoquinol methylase